MLWPSEVPPPFQTCRLVSPRIWSKTQKEMQPPPRFILPIYIFHTYTNIQSGWCLKSPKKVVLKPTVPVGKLRANNPKHDFFCGYFAGRENQALLLQHPIELLK